MATKGQCTEPSITLQMFKLNGHKVALYTILLKLPKKKTDRLTHILPRCITQEGEMVEQG